MKCQILFSGKSKKNIINLSSAELAQRVVLVKTYCPFELCLYPHIVPALSRLISPSLLKAAGTLILS